MNIKHLYKTMASLLLLGGANLLWSAHASAQTSCGQTPVNLQSSTQTKNLLCYLKNNAYISGQTDLADADKVKQWTGRYPAIVAFDFYNYTGGDTSGTQTAIDFAKNKKGIVAFQWHWKCPRGGEYYTDCAFDQDMNNTGSKLYQDIDLIARELKKMGDAGVPVVFRPLHEANDNFMWWAKKGADNYKRLWKLIFDRVNAQGANNIIWVFNGMASTGGYRSNLRDWYPGDSMVDIVSSDYYQSWTDYNTLKAIGNNKIVAISETFNELNPASEAPFSFSVVWAFRDCYKVQGQPSSGDVKGCENSWRTAMANSKTISIDQLPDFNANSSSSSSSGPSNISLGKPVSATSIEGPGYEAARLVDGNSSTRWASALNAGTASITLDLGGQYDLSSLRLQWEAAYATAYNVQVSSDNLNFSSPIVNKTNGVGGIENIPVTGQGRYLRINMTAKANAAWGYSLWEVSVYGNSLNTGTSSSSIQATSSQATSSVKTSSSVATSAATTSSVSSSVSNNSQFTCIVTQTGSWQGGYQADVKVTNTGASVGNWMVYLNFNQPAQITSSWNATLTGNGTTQVTATNVSYNGTLASGASTTFGITGNTPTGFALPGCSGKSGGMQSSMATSSAVKSSVVSSVASSVVSSSTSSVASSVKSSIATTSSATTSSASTADKQGVATHFLGFGEPYGGCGIPQSKLETQNFVALNVFNSPGNYTYWPRPLSGANLGYLGEFDNGKNCGRWVHVTIQEDCNGLNDGAQNQPFCRGGTGWFDDGKKGAELDMLVADSCGDDNAWCRDSRYHLDLATGAVTSRFMLAGQPVNLLPDNFNNRKISWHYIEAPNYQGDINIYFMQGAEAYWPAIAINNLKNGIHGVEQLVNGQWVRAAMNSDMGQAYILQGGVSRFQIRVYDVNDQLINGGRVYTFDFPTSACGNKCTAPVTQVTYGIQ